MLFRCMKLYQNIQVRYSILMRNASTGPGILKIRKKLGKTFDNDSLNNYWFYTNTGTYIKMGIITTIAVTPVLYCFLRDGPFLEYTFKKAYDVNDDLPNHLNELIEPEYSKFIAGLDVSDVRKVKFSIQETTTHLDSVGRGANTASNGAYVGLPFYLRFEAKEEAYEYAKKHLEPFIFLKHPVNVNWDSPIGQQIIETMVLTPQAKRFLISRDLYAYENWLNTISRGYNWMLYSLTAGITAYTISHFKKRALNAFRKFIGTCLFLHIIAYFASREYYYAYRFMNNQYGDSESASRSKDYSSGAKEYYVKMLKRNRLLTSVLGKSGLTTPELALEDEDIEPAVQGDDF